MNYPPKVGSAKLYSQLFLTMGQRCNMRSRYYLILLSLFFCESCQKESNFSQKGRELVIAENWPEVQEHYNRAPRVKSHNIASYHAHTLAKLYLSGEPEDLAEDLAKNLANLAADEESAARLYYDIGNYFLRKGQKTTAITYYEKSLILKPAFAPAAQNLELAYLLKVQEMSGQGATAQGGHSRLAPPKRAEPLPISPPETGAWQAGSWAKKPAPEKGHLDFPGQEPMEQKGRESPLKERLMLLLGQESVLILTPSATEQPESLNDYPNW